MILITDVRVVCPVTGTDQTKDILIGDDRILMTGPDLYDGIGQMMREKIISEGTDTKSLTLINGQGLIAAPGFVDPHVHFRDPGFPWKEDIMTGAASAAKGGYTTVICMANTDPPADCPEILRYVLDKGKETPIRVLCASALTKGMAGKELTDMETMAKCGAVIFTDDGKCVSNAAVLLEGLKKAASLNIPVSLHEEDPMLVKAAGVNAGKVAAKIGYAGASREAEESVTARDSVLAGAARARICIQHVSSAGTVRIIRMAKKAGVDIHAEATPHHFFFTEEEVLRSGTNARMNPPLRTEEDRQAIIEGLKDGTIDMIATDHAPHSREEKALPMDKAPSGVIGLETALGAGIRALVRPGHLSLIGLMNLMSASPAAFAGLTPVAVTPGSRADLVLFDENEIWTVRGEDFASKASNSPFIGLELPGQVKCTICGGKIVYRHESLTVMEESVTGESMPGRNDAAK